MLNYNNIHTRHNIGQQRPQVGIWWDSRGPQTLFGISLANYKTFQLLYVTSIYRNQPSFTLLWIKAFKVIWFWEPGSKCGIFYNEFVFYQSKWEIIAFQTVIKSIKAFYLNLCLLALFSYLLNNYVFRLREKKTFEKALESGDCV